MFQILPFIMGKIKLHKMKKNHLGNFSTSKNMAKKRFYGVLS